MNRQNERQKPMKEKCTNMCVFTVESMFSAMCECQALHPDPEDEDSDNDFEGEEYDLEGAGMGKTFQHTPNTAQTNIHATHITSTVQICFVCIELTYSGEPLPATRTTFNS